MAKNILKIHQTSYCQNNKKNLLITLVQLYILA